MLCKYRDLSVVDTTEENLKSFPVFLFFFFFNVISLFFKKEIMTDESKGCVSC